MEALAQSDQERLTELAEQIHTADAAMTDIGSRIVQYRREHGLSVEQAQHGGVVITDSHLRELEREFGAARQHFYSLLNERAKLLQLIGQGG